MTREQRRFELMGRIQRATRIKNVLRDAGTCEEAMVLCLATMMLAHRNLPFNAEAVETMARVFLESVEDMIRPLPQHK